MTTFSRIKYKDGDRTRTVFLRNSERGGLTISGIEVNRFGDEIRPSGHDRRLRIIDRDCILEERSQILDRTFDELIDE